MTTRVEIITDMDPGGNEYPDPVAYSLKMMNLKSQKDGFDPRKAV